MENKFEGILSDPDMSIITSVLSAVDVIEERHKINLIETVCNVVLCHQDWFENLKVDEKFSAITMLALTFNMLLDKEINPFAAQRIKIGVDAFNNNIFSASMMGGASYASN